MTLAVTGSENRRDKHVMSPPPMKNYWVEVRRRGRQRDKVAIQARDKRGSEVRKDRERKNMRQDSQKE